MADYYDAVLALIPVTLIGLALTLNAVGFAFTTALPVGAMVAGGIVGHAMFVKSPVASSAPPPPSPWIERSP